MTPAELQAIRELLEQTNDRSNDNWKYACIHLALKRLPNALDEIERQAKEIERLQQIIEGGRLPDFAWRDE